MAIFWNWQATPRDVCPCFLQSLKRMGNAILLHCDSAMFLNVSCTQIFIPGIRRLPFGLYSSQRAAPRRIVDISRVCLHMGVDMYYASTLQGNSPGSHRPESKLCAQRGGRRLG